MLRRKVVEWVASGDFGLGSGRPSDPPERVWFRQTVASEEVSFDSGVCLLTKGRAEALKAPPARQGETPAEPAPGTNDSSGATADSEPAPGASPEPQSPEPPEPRVATLRLHGDIPAEIWNRVGTRLIPKLRAGSSGGLRVDVAFELTTSERGADALLTELRQILDDLRLTEQVRIDVG